MIVKSYDGKRVRLVRTKERSGKESAQKSAIESATGDILIFSDVATRLRPDGVANIVKSFADATVGCVSSIDKFIDREGNISGEGAYVRYEMLLRRLETEANTLVGLSGSFFAARSDVCRDWRTDLQSDFNTVMNSVKGGLRAVLDEEAIGYYTDITDGRKESQRKVRTVLRGISVFMKNLGMLNIFRYGMFSWQLISHKLCRWLVPFALGTALASNLVLARLSGGYLALCLLQCLFYTAALAGMAGKPSGGGRGLLKIPTFFVLVNVSILQAWFRYFRGDRVIRWEPSKR
jgi:hypothetical protein